MTLAGRGICRRLGIVCDAVEPKRGFVRHTSCRTAMEPDLARPPMLGWLSAGKCFSIMLPIWIEAADCRGWAAKNTRMCARSHRLPYDCGKLKNFAPPIEPSAVPARPTLRDGR